MVANVRGEATSKKQQSGVREGGEAWLVCGQDTGPRRLIAYFVLTSRVGALAPGLR